MKDIEVNSKCPNCGSQLKYDTKTKQLKCISCSSLFDIESFKKGDLDEEERDYFEVLRELMKNKVTKEVVSSLRCENCGAMLRHDENTTSIVCPFCASSHIVETNFEEDIIPITGIIPFNIDKAECNLKFHKWIGGKLFAPSKFKNSNFVLDIHPLYLPFWTFDIDCYTKYSARRGDREYVTIRTTDAQGNTITKRECRMDWSTRSGTCHNSFDDLVVLACKNQSNRYYIERVCKFNFNVMEKFNPKFLIGYPSEKISIPVRDGFLKAKDSIKPEIERTIKRHVGGDEVKILSYSTTYEDVTFKQVLMPIYNGIYDYNGRKYSFAMNGQTGEFEGGYPISGLRVFIFVVIIVLVISLVGYLSFYYGA